VRSDRGRLLLQALVRLPARDLLHGEPPDERQENENEDGLSEESKHTHSSAGVRREVRERVPWNVLIEKEPAATTLIVAPHSPSISATRHICLAARPRNRAPCSRSRKTLAFTERSLSWSVVVNSLK
jgi:hypothetical protein